MTLYSLQIPLSEPGRKRLCAPAVFWPRWAAAQSLEGETAEVLLGS